MFNCIRIYVSAMYSILKSWANCFLSLAACLVFSGTIKASSGISEIMGHREESTTLLAHKKLLLHSKSYSYTHIEA